MKLTTGSEEGESELTREKLRYYKRNQTELASVILSLDRLQEELEWVKGEYIVSGKVMKSSKDFPYIVEHRTVMVPDPKRTDPIRERIRKKERRKAELEAEMQEVEAYIDSLPEGMDKQIFEMVYLDGITQQKAGEVLGYTQARVSQIIRKFLKDL